LSIHQQSKESLGLWSQQALHHCFMSLLLIRCGDVVKSSSASNCSAFITQVKTAIFRSCQETFLLATFNGHGERSSLGGTTAISLKAPFPPMTLDTWSIIASKVSLDLVLALGAGTMVEK
jgi:hypothetical protein